MTSLQKIGVIGGGAWGTALALALLRAGRDVLLWAREDDVVQSINQSHENKTYLSGLALDPKLQATSDLHAMASRQVWLLVTPVQHTRSICSQLASIGAPSSLPVILCSKGIEMGTLKFPQTIIEESLPTFPLAVLSGPSFAAEVARDQPTAITLACANEALGKELTYTIGSRTFRPYYSDDVIGAQIGGAIKNVLAVATGIAAGCKMGENARAALITRGLAEMMRLGLALGAKAETLMGLSGLGDLTLTCSSTQSRNMSLGFALGEGRKLADILAERKSVAEGVPTAAAAANLARLHGVDMPIVGAVDAILNHGSRVDETIAALLARPFKAETL